MGHAGTFYVTTLHPDGSGDCRPGDTWHMDYVAGVARRLRDDATAPVDLELIGRAALAGACRISRRPPLRVLAPHHRRPAVA